MPSARSQVSAGILLFRRRGTELQVLLAHPGGPYWKQQRYGSWSVPKGIAEGDEALEAVAAREFEEETGFRLDEVVVDGGRERLDLGEIRMKSGKVVRAWAVEGDLDPAHAHSNEIEIEWPPRTGRRLTIPEVDRVEWFGLDEARRRAHPAQAAFVDRLVVALGDERAAPRRASAHRPEGAPGT
ncbi:MAG TPA: NUDIX domain-containing protein [Candidatus Binatia bacterium]|nr:NUDIX domain-containing protein [Candidatus Binatia bacterium]